MILLPTNEAKKGKVAKFGQIKKGTKFSRTLRMPKLMVLIMHVGNNIMGIWGKSTKVLAAR